MRILNLFDRGPVSAGSAGSAVLAASRAGSIFLSASPAFSWEAVSELDTSVESGVVVSSGVPAQATRSKGRANRERERAMFMGLIRWGEINSGQGLTGT